MTRWIPCRDFVEFLDDYVAGRLQPPQLAEFNNHLARCPPCVAYMQSYEKAVSLGKRVYAKSDEPVPSNVPEELLQAILAARKRI